MLVVIWLGCAAQAVRPESAAVPSTMPTIVPSGKVTLHLDDAVVASDLEKGDWEVDMQSQIPFKDRPLFFGELATSDNNDKVTASIPLIGFKKNDKMMSLKIEDQRLVNASWSYIAAGPTTQEFWGVLDASLDDHQFEIVMVHSTDSGSTLQISSLPKPLPVAVFDSFCMDREGHGRLSLYVYRDQAKLKRAGYYHYRTSDGGKTWTCPEHEADGMLPADDAPEDIGDPAQKPAKA
jgi:hypothetical protein